MPSALERAWRDERAWLVASLARRYGDLDLAEDAVQEAFAAASRTWPNGGEPESPGAWLNAVAARKAIDLLRRRTAHEGRVSSLELEPDAPPATTRDESTGGLPGQDDVLLLMFTCCHPALSVEARVALTLRHVAGLSVEEVAAALLVTPATMTKRLVRARRKIRDAGMRFVAPERDGLPERLGAALSVIYLVFNEGYLSQSDGPALRIELCDEAIWLARQVHRLVPDDPEVAGLLALLLFQHARAAARDVHGELVSFAEQDRTRWDHAMLDDARTVLRTTGFQAPGLYQVQAAIAALHASSTSAEGVNWPRIADLYDILARLSPSPVVLINRAVVVARVQGVSAGLALLEDLTLDPRVTDNVTLHVARGELLERQGDTDAARLAWQAASAATANPAQRARFDRRAALTPSPSI